MIPKHIVYTRSTGEYRIAYIGDDGDLAQKKYLAAVAAGSVGAAGWVKNGVLYKTWSNPSGDKPKRTKKEKGVTNGKSDEPKVPLPGQDESPDESGTTEPINEEAGDEPKGTVSGEKETDEVVPPPENESE